VLEEISYEWGDIPSSEEMDVCFTNLSPNAHALIWRDDGELRIDLLDLLGNNELKSLKQLPRNGFNAFDSESLKPLSRLAFEVF